MAEELVETDWSLENSKRTAERSSSNEGAGEVSATATVTGVANDSWWAYLGDTGVGFAVHYIADGTMDTAEALLFSSAPERTQLEAMFDWIRSEDNTEKKTDVTFGTKVSKWKPIAQFIRATVRASARVAMGVATTAILGVFNRTQALGRKFNQMLHAIIRSLGFYFISKYTLKRFYENVGHGKLGSLLGNALQLAFSYVIYLLGQTAVVTGVVAEVTAFFASFIPAAVLTAWGAVTAALSSPYVLLGIAVAAIVILAVAHSADKYIKRRTFAVKLTIAEFGGNSQSTTYKASHQEADGRLLQVIEEALVDPAAAEKQELLSVVRGKKYLRIEGLGIGEKKMQRARSLGSDLAYKAASERFFSGFIWGDIERAYREEVDTLEYVLFTIQDGIATKPFPKPPASAPPVKAEGKKSAGGKSSPKAKSSSSDSAPEPYYALAYNEQSLAGDVNKKAAQIYLRKWIGGKELAGSTIYTTYWLPPHAIGNLMLKEAGLKSNIPFNPQTLHYIAAQRWFLNSRTWDKWVTAKSAVLGDHEIFFQIHPQTMEISPDRAKRRGLAGAVPHKIELNYYLLPTKKKQNHVDLAKINDTTPQVQTIVRVTTKYILSMCQLYDIELSTPLGGGNKNILTTEEVEFRNLLKA